MFKRHKMTMSFAEQSVMNHLIAQNNELQAKVEALTAHQESSNKDEEASDNE